MKQYGKQHSANVQREETFNLRKADQPGGRGEDAYHTNAYDIADPVGTFPAIDPETYRLWITGLVKKPLELSLEDIYEEFPRVSIAATIRVTNNRRDMAVTGKIEREPEEIEAVGTAVWTGIRLRHVLLWTGVESGAAHVAFRGMNEVALATEPIRFGGSITKEKAMSPEVLLAYEMNGVLLTPEHGYPLQVVVPGKAGAWSVKWLREIAVLAEPPDNHSSE